VDKIVKAAKTIGVVLAVTAGVVYLGPIVVRLLPEPAK
jgi:hypothetical protein